MKQLYICPYKDECVGRIGECPHKVPHEYMDSCNTMNCKYYDGKMTKTCQPIVQMNRNGANG